MDKPRAGASFMIHSPKHSATMYFVNVHEKDTEFMIIRGGDFSYLYQTRGCGKIHGFRFVSLSYQGVSCISEIHEKVPYNS